MGTSSINELKKSHQMFLDNSPFQKNLKNF